MESGEIDDERTDWIFSYERDIDRALDGLEFHRKRAERILNKINAML